MKEGMLRIGGWHAVHHQDTDPRSRIDAPKQVHAVPVLCFSVGISRL